MASLQHAFIAITTFTSISRNIPRGRNAGYVQYRFCFSLKKKMLFFEKKEITTVRLCFDTSQLVNNNRSRSLSMKYCNLCFQQWPLVY